MIQMKAKTIPFRDKRTGRFVSTAAYKNIGHAAASIAKDAKGSIRKSEKPSNEGQPPHSSKGLFKTAIRFAMDPGKKLAVIGVRKSVAGESGRAHEIGGNFKGDNFEQRKFMEPALERAAPRFAGSFAGSIGE